jgi:hypothetical protein
MADLNWSVATSRALLSAVIVGTAYGFAGSEFEDWFSLNVKPLSGLSSGTTKGIMTGVVTFGAVYLSSKLIV